MPSLPYNSNDLAFYSQDVDGMGLISPAQRRASVADCHLATLRKPECQGCSSLISSERQIQRLLPTQRWYLNTMGS